MHWFRYIALAFVLLQVAHVQADFGITPAISGATTVEQYSRRIRDEANGIVSAYEDIALEGPTPAFNEAAAALKAMFEQIVIFVQPIAQSIGTLALNDVGPAEDLFGDADTKINAMSTFITGSAQTQLATIQTKVSIYVRTELNDILNTIKTTLTELRNALSALRTAVISARTNRATTSNVQNYVKPSMVVLVQTKTLQLATDLPAASFSAIETARTINQANVFIQTGITVSSGITLSELWESEMLKEYENIINFLERLKTLVGTEIPLVNGRIAQFAQAFSPLTTPLLSKYSEIDTVYGKITSGTGDNVLNAYKTLVSSAIGYINNLLNNFYPPIEPAIKRLSEVLVQRGKYSDFCYETYYPKVEQYLFSGEMSLLTCLNAELDREKSLMEAIVEVIYEMQFFLEDTNAHLNTCYRISLFNTPLANNCLEEHTEFSELIPCTAIKEYATMLQLLCKEVDSLRFRLWACVSRDTASFPLEAKDILANIEKCQQFGPQ
ncbi:uncharacterized protein LOC118505353 [Anopheles stephensi]|uniref:uncharacterized protein LOC118505353 n=1 Tax=Anopheles stephensi TaxID=30069 RepID=UPI0007D1511B|nr:uncharacterized protein LOC118505353 [Anopheles stephensi]XP_035896918.1 uncharacterized protein LOC118505353 [Anopheles stephensi]